jgi:hypothetical protein
MFLMETNSDIFMRTIWNRILHMAKFYNQLKILVLVVFFSLFIYILFACLVKQALAAEL